MAETMTPLTCVYCGLPIAKGESAATGPSGALHYRCYTVGKMHGQQVTLPRCSNCNAPLFRGDTCHQCGYDPRIASPTSTEGNER